MLFSLREILKRKLLLFILYFIVWTSKVCSAKLSFEDFLWVFGGMQLCETTDETHSITCNGKYKDIKCENKIKDCAVAYAYILSLSHTHTCAHTAVSHCRTQPMPRGTLFKTNQKDTGGCVRQHSSQLTGSSSSDMWAEQRLKKKTNKSQQQVWETTDSRIFQERGEFVIFITVWSMTLLYIIRS